VTSVCVVANFIVRQGNNNVQTYLQAKARIQYPCPNDPCYLDIPIGGLLNTIENAIDDVTGNILAIQELRLDGTLHLPVPSLPPFSPFAR
jgi:hypothetical protein